MVLTTPMSSGVLGWNGMKSDSDRSRQGQSCALCILELGRGFGYRVYGLGFGGEGGQSDA